MHISPIGQSRCSLDAQGCCWGLCHNLPTNRRCDGDFSGSLCPQMEDTPKPDNQSTEQHILNLLYTQAYTDEKKLHIFLSTSQQSNTHINLFDSLWKLQSLVESVDIDSVCGVFMHEWWLQGKVKKEQEQKLKHISLSSYETFHKHCMDLSVHHNTNINCSITNHVLWWVVQEGCSELTVCLSMAP